ncbi:MAG: hypothetical protein AAF663_04365 [Planctomycetota bacterium]
MIRQLLKESRLGGVLGSSDEKTFVDNDDRLAALAPLGIEDFVYNTQGWVITAIDAPIERVSAALSERSDVSQVDPRVGVEKLTDGAGCELKDDGFRTYFAIQIASSRWTVLVHIVHYFTATDLAAAFRFAYGLSKTLDTEAIVAWDDDFAGSSGFVCRSGQKIDCFSDSEDEAYDEDGEPIEVERADDEPDDVVRYYLRFYERGIAVPDCFISNADRDVAVLLAKEPEAILRADRFQVVLPEPQPGGAGGVMHKLASFAELASGGLDADDFTGSLAERMWRAAVAASGD